jgi:4-hydroxyphenylpyruvate dioxygenase
LFATEPGNKLHLLSCTMVADNGSTGAVKLVGYNNFVRHNPKSDKFTIHRFHHVEFWCADATNTYKR